MKKANEQQACKLAGVLVEHHHLFTAAPASALQWAIHNPKDAIEVFVTALAEKAKQVAETAKKVLTPFIRLRVGGTTADKLIKAIESPNKTLAKEKNEIGDEARYLMNNKVEFSTTVEEVDFVKLTLEELGFTKNPRTDEFMTKEFCAEWSRKNLDGYVIELCTSEDGPQLRRQYQDQPNGEDLWMAMERLAGSGSGTRVFNVRRFDGGSRWLYADWSHPDNRWFLGSCFVFRFRKVTPSVT